MMTDVRIALNEQLRYILGNNNVYFQPPSKLSYPCIVFSLSDVPMKYANNKNYIKEYCFTLTLIHEDPDNEIIDRLLDLPYVKFIKHFSTQGLNHYVLEIHYKNEKEIINYVKNCMG